jgi:CheY-like chemotaxis protein
VTARFATAPGRYRSGVARLLLADDDPAFRQQLEELLAANLPELELVASVSDGHQAVAAAMTHSPSVVVIDYSMPGPTGGHAAAVIQQALPGALIVVVSGLPAEEVPELPPNVVLVRKGAGIERELVDALAAHA